MILASVDKSRFAILITMEKRFTNKQVFVLILAIIAGIALMETTGGNAVWTWTFLREFLQKMLLYGATTVVVVMLVGKTLDL